MKRCVLFVLMISSITLVNAQIVDVIPDDDVALSVGYVNKQWSSKINSSTYNENLWGEENKRLHGIQAGITYRPTLINGLGVYTGLFAEFYFSFSKAMGYDEFTEFCLYLPIHANFNIPITHKISVNMHGGFGFNYACHGSFTNSDAYYIDYEWSEDFGEYIPEKHYYELDHIGYGGNGWPKRLNAALELSVGLRINNVLVSGSYSWGLINHKFYKDVPNSRTLQNKMSFSVELGL